MGRRHGGCTIPGIISAVIADGILILANGMNAACGWDIRERGRIGGPGTGRRERQAKDQDEAMNSQAIQIVQRKS